MARQKTILERNTFVKGLVTEANALTFPENASSDEVNFTLKRDGSRRRRLGLDVEPGAEPYKSLSRHETYMPSMKTNSLLWDNAFGVSGEKAVVLQIGRKILLIKENLSHLGAADPIELYSLPATVSDNSDVSMCFINQYLIITHISLEKPVVIEYNNIIPSYKDYTLWLSENGLTPTPANQNEFNSLNREKYIVSSEYLLNRDLFGMHTDNPLDYRPWANVDASPPFFNSYIDRYNLINQGWPTDKATSLYPRQTSGSDLMYYPSNSDIPWVCRGGDGTWKPENLRYTSFGATPAPKGRFILPYQYRGATRVKIRRDGWKQPTDFSNASFWYDEGTNDEKYWIKADSYRGTATKCVAFAGRVFYSGFTSESDASWYGKEETSPDYNSSIMFSQVVDNKDKLHRCYQANDPTAEDAIGIVADDGGFIQIAGMGSVIGLEQVGKSLFVFASNGVWEITGDSNYGHFRADAYSVNKITSEGVAGSGSIVNLGGDLIYWSDGGIYSISMDSTGGYTASNISETSIQTLYNSIPFTSKVNAKGIYDEEGRTIRWLYYDKTKAQGEIVMYNSELVFDVVLKAWYKYSIPIKDGEDLPSSTYIAGYVPVGAFFTKEYLDPIVDNQGTQITTNSGEVVSVARYSSEEQVTGIKYLLLNISDFTDYVAYNFGYYWRDNFVDFNGEDAAAYMVTGSEFLGSTMTKKGGIKMHVHLLRTETGFELDVDGNLDAKNSSSCIVTPKWDLADSMASGKIGRPFQAYRMNRAYMASGINDSFDYGWEVITSKNTIRGSGKSIAVRFDTEPGKDCNLLGWALEVPQKEDT